MEQVVGAYWHLGLVLVLHAVGSVGTHLGRLPLLNVLVVDARDLPLVLLVRCLIEGC